MASYALKLLGPSRVEHNGVVQTGIESDKALALLAYLAVQKNPISRSSLVGMFWNEFPETRGQGNLRRVLHNLNQLFPGCLEITRQSVCFSGSNSFEVDLDQFKALTETQEQPQALEAAIALYKGPLLEGLSISSSPEFELWLDFERERWQGRALQVLDRLIKHYTRQGEYVRAMDFVDRALELAGWDENFHYHKMYLLAHNGQRTAAIRQYQICRRILAEELDTLPSPELESLYQRLHQAEGPFRQDLLPPQISSFVGRRRELAQIVQRLTRPDCRLLTLSGPGGIGKTRLALQLARQVNYLFLDGVVFVSLVDVQTAANLTLAVLTALDPDAANPPSQSALIRYLSDKELLIILDNFENLLNGPAAERQKSLRQIGEWLAAAPKIRLLVTSCDRLELASEWVVSLTGLPLHPDAEIAPSSQGTAPELFLERARQAGSEFTETPETQSAILGICRLLDGVPLAIELAATLTPYFSCREILSQIQKSLDVLALSCDPVATPSRHRSLRTVFERAWDRLTRQEQEIFAALSVFKGGFTLPAATTVVEAPLSILQMLTAKSLLRMEPEGRYQIHETLRRFSEEQLPAGERAAALKKRHLDYFLELMKSVQKEQSSDIQAPHTKLLTQEYANLIGALDWARRNAVPEIGLQLALKMIGFWDAAGAPSEGCEWLSTLAAQAVQAPPSLRASAYNQAGGLAWRQGHLDLAEQYQQLALDIYREIADPKGIAITLEHLSLICTHRGDLETALDYGRQSLARFYQIEDWPNIALVLNNLGMSAVEQGDLEPAREYLEESRAIYRRLGLKRGMLMVLNNCGNVARYQGHFQQAAEFFQQALDLERELNDPYTRAIILGNLGYIEAREGNPAQALALYQQALDQFNKLDRQRDIAETLERIAALEAQEQAPESAVRLFAAAAALRAALKTPLLTIDQNEQERILDRLKARLTPAAFARHWNQGEAGSGAEMVAYALALKN